MDKDYQTAKKQNRVEGNSRKTNKCNTRANPRVWEVIHHSKEDTLTSTPPLRGPAAKMLARLFPAGGNFWRLLCNKPETDCG